MSWRDAFYSLLSTDAALVAIVAAANMAPVRNAQGIGYPRITWLEVTGQPDVALSGWTGADHVRLEVDVWSKTRDQAISAGARIRALMEQTNTAFSAVCITDQDGPVADGLEIHRRLLEFNLWTL